MRSKSSADSLPARAAALAGAALLCLCACGGRGIDTGSGAVVLPTTDCSSTALKQTLLTTTRDWYLFPDLLPASVDLAQYADPGALLDALTAAARAQGKDRFFSSTTSIATEDAQLQGQSVGFGVTFVESASPPAVTVGQVFAGSAAAEAGLQRGDQILAIGTSSATLQPIADVLAAPDGLTTAIGPATSGIARTLRWRNLAGTTFERVVTKRGFALDAVPAQAVRILTAPGGQRVGHLTLRSFVADSNIGIANLAALRSAFATFAAQGVRDVIVDLRYNGGGLVSIAELMMNLIAGDQAGQVAYSTQFNAAHAASAETHRFVRQAETLPTMHVAFVVTDKTASASELVINGLAPYVQTALIGTRTYGKPVGQLAFDATACDFRIRLVGFRLLNRNNDSDYYTGLPYAGYTRVGGVACAARDDFTREPGDPLEAMTAEALRWIAQPTAPCSAGSIADTSTSAAAGAASTKTQLPRGGGAAAPSAEPLPYYLPGTY
jgi:C-terminal processing protease CtpA/Prc